MKTWQFFMLVSQIWWASSDPDKAAYGAAFLLASLTSAIHAYRQERKAIYQPTGRPE